MSVIPPTPLWQIGVVLLFKELLGLAIPKWRKKSAHYRLKQSIKEEAIKRFNPDNIPHHHKRVLALR